ncbi:MAG: DUF1906 domain-containing protein [Clostridiales bacterium]|nr:DUF1906 domain-containing protein [Clostridiales bacterium]
MPHWGMSAWHYPGDYAMKIIKEHSDFKFTGFYLTPSPAHEKSHGWMDKRDVLESQGWGIAPIFSGRQPSSNERGTSLQGAFDANSAVSLARGAGFPPGTVIYLDVGAGIKVPASFIEYIKAWTERIEGHSSAGYHPGVRCYYKSVSQVSQETKARIWAVKVLPTWNCKYDVTESEAPSPSGCGLSIKTIIMWELLERCIKSYKDVIVEVNLIASSSINPGMATQAP